ncbi:hypothetical protein [Nocardia sp. NPDC049149]|uniref:hypothetical protein n=1 Tax=Nocardia sp. NPDC049149 TaxID=3364315 RepID=UPI0037185881
MFDAEVTLQPGEYVISAADIKRVVGAVGDQLAAMLGQPQLGEDAVTVLEPLMADTAAVMRES